MIPILLALAYTAMDQGEWWMGMGVAGLAMVACMVEMGGGNDTA